MVPSPLYYEGVLYVLKNGGLLTSFNPKTGSVEKAGRVAGALRRLLVVARGGGRQDLYRQRRRKGHRFEGREPNGT